MENILSAIWSLGSRVRDALKRVGLLGPLDGALSFMAELVFPRLQGPQVVELPGGLQMLVPPDSVSSRSYTTGTYERDVTAIVRQVVKPGMTAVDLGASVGYYTLILSSLVGVDGRVFAFEPDPEAFSYLSRNVEQNRISNVEAISNAVSARTGVMQFTQHQGTARNAVVRWDTHVPAIHDPISSPSYLHVVSTTLDDFFGSKGWPSVHLIKMDIEGSEYAALTGMRLLARRNPTLALVMELNPHTMKRSSTTAEMLRDILLELGFGRAYVIERRLKVNVRQGLPQSSANHNLLLTRS